ncbi:Uncharacterized protein SCF082_LOCUS24022 [Durusdinium trenchii]|uniref:Uncharacterized protein n=1 Tax=Durusdinium trenchii TaxID=1381693 RepID=A0ABP0LR29_9DINO
MPPKVVMERSLKMSFGDGKLRAIFEGLVGNDYGARAEAQEIFEEEKDQPKRQKRTSPQVVTVGLNGTQVDIHCPLKRLASPDLVVALDPTQLAAVFEFLQEDCSMLETARKKRKYRRPSDDEKSEVLDLRPREPAMVLGEVPLPSEQILNDVQQLEQLQRSAREQVKGREREVDPEGLEILRPRSGKTAVAKFLTNACLPRNYAVQWQKQSTRPRKVLPSPATPKCDWDDACCIVEAASTLSVHLGPDRIEKVPPRTWLLLEPPEPGNRAVRSPDRQNEFKELVHFVTKKNTCLLSSCAGGGWLEDQPGITLLRPVPVTRLHHRAAEANFCRASGGVSLLALRHAQRALELLKDERPPEKIWLEKPVGFAFPPAKPMREEAPSS